MRLDTVHIPPRALGEQLLRHGQTRAVQLGEDVGRARVHPPAEVMVSVVVAVYGNTEALPALASAIAAQEFVGSIELIIVDNQPVPALTAGLQRVGPMDALVVHEPQVGLSRARNTGIRRAGGEFILVTDPDARPHRAWASQMVRALQESDACCAGGRVEAYFPGGPQSRLPADALQMFVPPAWPGTTTELVAPYWVVGCNLGFRREPTPWFDTRFGVTGARHLSCEELELTVRTQREGRRVVVVPEAVVYRAIHPHDLTMRAFLARALWHGVSIARLLAVHPYADVYDSYRVRDALVPSRWGTRAGRRGAATDLARIVGLHAERIRHTVSGRQRSTAIAEQSAGTGEFRHG
ncbi:glycosyltransferase family 2 protein [Streptacidiphilus cavernicola]|uniref:Glycosyltransferase family 2 protein n=1 Tax=Streptacidiphilus cavernicola TaxID=3342716 RepID=A0ABV6VYX2_9ACTN